MFLVLLRLQKTRVVDLEEPDLAVLEAAEDILAGAMGSLAQKEVREGHEVHALRQGKVAAL